MSCQLRHAILGAGGVGGLMGACVARSGDAVTLIVRRESIAQYPKKIHLQSPFGNFDAEVATDAEVPAVDVLWLTVKATQLESALIAIGNPDSVRAIVPLLNGIDHVSLLRARYGAQQVIPATIAVESERVGPGHIVHRSPFARLNVSSAGQPLLESTVQRLQEMGFECKFIDDEPTLMWGKLVFLAPFALATTAADKSVGEVLADPVWRDLAISCFREACAVAVAEGAKVEPEAVVAGALKFPGTMRSSMQKDVEQHKPPELDAIAGPLLRGAARHKIAIPATKELAAGVERRVSGTRGSS